MPPLFPLPLSQSRTFRLASRGTSEDNKRTGRWVGEEEMNGREYHAAAPALTDFWNTGQEALPSIAAEHKNRHRRSEQDRHHNPG